MNVHYLDKAAFMDGNADEGEEAMVLTQARAMMILL